MSEKIIKSFLTKYEGLNKNELPPKIIDYYLDLSDIYLKYGELEQFKSDFKSAFDFFIQSLELKKKYDDPLSRAVAEVYYMMANVADFDAKKALICLYKTYLIMKKHLMKELKHEITIYVDFENVNLDEIKLDNELLNKNDDDKEEVIELKEIMAELKLKIEDVSEEIKIMDQYINEKKSLKKEEFTKKYDENNLIDLNKSGMVKKRKREDITITEENENNKGKVAKISENGVTKIVTISPESKLSDNKEEEKNNSQQN